MWSLAITGHRRLRRVHKKELASTDTHPFPALSWAQGPSLRRANAGQPCLFFVPLCVRQGFRLQGYEQVTLINAKFTLKEAASVFFSHLLPPHKWMKCLSGNRPYPRIPQDVNTGNFGLEKAAVVRTTRIINASLAAYSLPGPNHSPYASRPLSHLTVCKWGQKLRKWFAALFSVYNKKPQMKAFLKSALYEQRCPSCSTELKAVLIKLLQVDWLCTDKPGQWSLRGSHSSPEGLRRPPLTHLNSRFG